MHPGSGDRIELVHPKKQALLACRRCGLPLSQARIHAIGPLRSDAERAIAHVPKSLVTTLAAGQFPELSRVRPSPPRWRACVRDQSYEEASRP
jgi:hypothetical protein